MKKINFQKNITSRRTDRSFRLNARGIIGVLLSCLVLLSVFRLGFLMFVKGAELRSKAEQNQLYDEPISAVRGTIYDCNMTPIVSSASAWILTVDPISIYRDYKNKFQEEVEEGVYDYEKAKTLHDKFCKFISKHIAKILGMKTKEVYDIISFYYDEETQKNIAYKRIKKKVTASERLKLDEIFAKEYDCNKGGFYVKPETDNDSKEKKNEKENKPITFKIGSYFSYENDNIRMYPDNNFASTIIGVTNYDGDGIAGVEQKYNDILKGVDGRKVTAKDAFGNALDSSYESIIDAQEGNGLVLTIDSNIQYYLENSLSQALKNTGANGTYGIVMDVDTGAVLAMSNKPDFNMNDAYTIVDEKAIDKIIKEEKKKGKEISKTEARTIALYNQWNSYCITSTYEPGSTFKLFTASAALEEGVADLSTTYTCTGGYKIKNGPVIHCANTLGHGTQTFTQGLMNSCNPFFINLGQKLGSETYYKYFEAFGFTEKTGIDLPGEASSVYHSKENLKVTELASTSFGQSFRISPIQLITAVCSIANGGKLMKPYVVDSVVDSSGNVISKTQPEVRRQVISSKTAQTVRQMMEAVVESGTGKNAYIPGYRVAGKTATSEKLDDDDKRYKMKYVASFVCFAPANDPQVAILVGVDEPPGEYRGGGVIAAPIAKEVMESTLKYLNVEPQYTAKELANVSKTAPNLVGETVGQAKMMAAEKGFSVKTVGSGDTVISQVPAVGQAIPDEGIIIIYTDDSAKSDKMVKVPDFNGLTASQANEKAHSVGINITLSGPSGEMGAVAYNQNIAAGTEVASGTSVTVYFHTTSQAAD